MRTVAAFASWNSGAVLIGVADDGSVVGVPPADMDKVPAPLPRRSEPMSRPNRTTPCVGSSTKVATSWQSKSLAARNGTPST
jgi:hypothetical protein